MDNFSFPGMVPCMSLFSQIVDVVFPENGLSMDQVAFQLDSMSHSERMQWMSKQNVLDQIRLWQLAVGRGVSLDHLVAEDHPAGTEVIHEGKNTLPVFSSFQKRVVRSIEDPASILGYNEGPIRPVIGPGYFIAEYDDVRGEVGVSYYRVPPPNTKLPDGWPAIKTNEEGLQKFVFSTMVDYLRKLSEHVCIGRAYKANKKTNNYFLLVRRD